MANTLVIDNKELALDKEGYLINLDDWNPAVADALAIELGITLETAHWEIIELLRDFYAERQLSPVMRIMVNLVKKNLGVGKGNSLYLLQLFPESSAKVACKIAGLPRPTNCL